MRPHWLQRPFTTLLGGSSHFQERLPLTPRADANALGRSDRIQRLDRCPGDEVFCNEDQTQRLCVQILDAEGVPLMQFLRTRSVAKFLS